MSARQREQRRAMVKRRWLPHCCAVALRTVMTEVSRHVIRIGCLLELCLMTLEAVHVMQLVVSIHVARLARCRYVGTCQREECRVMVKRRRIPVRRRVTLCAIVTEVACYVIRICRLLELCLMTLEAVRVMQLVVAAHMA